MHSRWELINHSVFFVMAGLIVEMLYGLKISIIRGKKFTIINNWANTKKELWWSFYLKQYVPVTKGIIKNCNFTVNRGHSWGWSPTLADILVGMFRWPHIFLCFCDYMSLINSPPIIIGLSSCNRLGMYSFVLWVYILGSRDY